MMKMLEARVGDINIAIEYDENMPNGHKYAQVQLDKRVKHIREAQKTIGLSRSEIINSLLDEDKAEYDKNKSTCPECNGKMVNMLDRVKMDFTFLSGTSRVSPYQSCFKCGYQREIPVKNILSEEYLDQKEKYLRRSAIRTLSEII